MPTKIEWCDETWNVMTGCTPCSEGCRNCYARRMAPRMAGRFGYPADEPFRPTFHEEKLSDPWKWKKPRRIFVNSMSDTFHDDFRDKQIRKLWDAMWAAPRHTFCVLTKRPVRMAAFVSDWAFARHFGWGDWKDMDPIRFGDIVDIDELFYRRTCGWALHKCEKFSGYGCKHPHNDYRGADARYGSCMSCYCPLGYELDEEDEECQEGDNFEYYPDSGMMRLHERPRFAFVENVWLGVTVENRSEKERIEYLRLTRATVRFLSCEPLLEPLGELDLNGIGWVIVGGETGPGTRPMEEAWAEDILDQCQKAGVPFFYKGSGGKVKNRLLRGQTWEEFPEGLK